MRRDQRHAAFGSTYAEDQHRTAFFFASHRDIAPTVRTDSCFYDRLRAALPAIPENQTPKATNQHKVTTEQTYVGRRIPLL